MNDFTTRFGKGSTHEKGSNAWPLNVWFKATINDVTLDEEATNCALGRLKLVLGGISVAESGADHVETPEGTFRIGRRLLFRDVPLDFTGDNAETVNDIAIKTLLQLGYAAGLATQETHDKQTVTVPLPEYADPVQLGLALAGRTIRFKVISTRLDKQGNVQPKTVIYAPVE